MAYKESNPAAVHIVQFIILLSVIGLLHLFLAIVGLNGFISISTDNPDMIFPSLMIGYFVASCIFPYVIPIYFIVVFSVSLVRRGVYGETHAKNTMRSFFLGIFGMIVPPVMAGICLMFIEVVDKIYYVLPFFAHMIPVAIVIATYLFVKDIGGKNKGMIGAVFFSASSLILSVIEFIGLIYTVEVEYDDGFVSFLFLFGMLMAIGAMIGVIFMIAAYSDAMKWTKSHKPLIDSQQKHQLEMQQNQIKMQIEQLKLQQEQLELQKRSMEMISDIRQESIEGGREMISGGSNYRTGGTEPGIKGRTRREIDNSFGNEYFDHLEDEFEEEWPEYD